MHSSSSKLLCKSTFVDLGDLSDEDGNYHNPNLGLVTKAKACKGAGQEGSMGVTSHALGSIGEFEGMNPHTPK